MQHTLEMVEPTTRDAAWFAQEIEHLLPALYGAARRFAGNATDAQDLVADAVAKAWMRRDSLKDPGAFRGWVFRILTNGFLSRRRADHAAGRQEPYSEDDAEPSFSLFERLQQPFLLWWHNPEQVFLNKLLHEDLERAVDGLAEPFRVVVVLADLEGLSYQEIAETLNIPVGTVRSRLARGRSHLQKALWSHAVDAGLKPPAPRGSPPQ